MWTIERVEVRRPERRFGHAVYVLGRWLGDPREDKAQLAVLVGEEWIPVQMNVSYDVPASLYLDDEQMGMLVGALEGAMPRQTMVETLLKEAWLDACKTRDRALAMLAEAHRPYLLPSTETHVHGPQT